MYCIKYLESDQLYEQLECLRRVNIRANSQRDFQLRLKECKEHSRPNSAISSKQYPSFHLYSLSHLSSTPVNSTLKAPIEGPEQFIKHLSRFMSHITRCEIRVC